MGYSIQVAIGLWRQPKNRDAELLADVHCYLADAHGSVVFVDGRPVRFVSTKSVHRICDMKAGPYQIIIDGVPLGYVKPAPVPIVVRQTPALQRFDVYIDSRRSRKRGARFNNEKSTWENTAKEQPYLMPGTETYEEYEHDLKEHDPFRPDDEFHKNEEEEIVETVTTRRETSNAMIEPTTAQKKALLQRRKRDVLNERSKEAKATPSKADDAAVANAKRQTIYNDGIMAEQVDEWQELAAYLPSSFDKYM